MLSYINKLSKYPNYKSELVSHLNIDKSEIFDTQAWTPKQRGDTEITLNRDLIVILKNRHASRLDYLNELI